jgi:hypothetical protein
MCPKEAAMALRPCKECGKQISTEAAVCPHCGKKIPKKADLGCTIAVLAVGGFILVAMIVIALVERTDTGGGGTSVPVTSPAERLASAMEQDFRNNGYDVDVRVSSPDKAIELTSDLFKDPEWRELEVSKLLEDRKVLCGLGIRYAKVGYSKGTFSSDVMKTISLKCPAEKTAR